MTATLPLELARRTPDVPTPAPPIPNKRCKSRGTAKRKQTTAKPPPPPPSQETPPAYEQFGTVPSNPAYHLARVGHAIRQARNIIVISGAGVSTPAIPDFRSSRGLFKALADEKAREGLYGRKEVDGEVGQASRSGIKSGKELFDVKCLTVSLVFLKLQQRLNPQNAAVPRLVATPPQPPQPPHTPHLPHLAHTIPPLPENTRRPRSPPPLLHPKH